MRVAVLHAPDGFDELLGEAPPGAQVQHGLKRSDRVDLILGFVTERAHVERNIDWLLSTLSPGGSFWVATPGAGTGLATDLTPEVLREVAVPRGWVPARTADLDDVWHAVQLVRGIDGTADRRGARAPAPGGQGRDAGRPPGGPGGRPAVPGRSAW